MDPVTLDCARRSNSISKCSAAKEEAGRLSNMVAPPCCRPRRPPAVEAEHEIRTTSDQQRDDINVDAVFAKLKTIGGKKAEDE